MYYFWGSLKYGPLWVKEQRDAVRTAMVKAAISAYGDPGRLRAALDPSASHEVRRLVRPSDQDEPMSMLTAPEDWTWLANPLLVLMRDAGPEWIEATVRVIGDFDTTDSLREGEKLGVVRTETYTMNRSRVETMFGANVDVLLEHVRTAPEGVWFVEAAREQATAWMAERRSTEPKHG